MTALNPTAIAAELAAEVIDAHSDDDLDQARAALLDLSLDPVRFFDEDVLGAAERLEYDSDDLDVMRAGVEILARVAQILVTRIAAALVVEERR